MPELGTPAGLMRGVLVVRAGMLRSPTSMSHSLERRVWKQDRTGNVGTLSLRKDELPACAAGEVRIAVKAVGLNMADVFTVLGLYSAAPKGDVIPGLEFAGIVEEVGPAEPQEETHSEAPATEAQQLQPGDRVYGVTRFGAFADRLNIKAEYLQPVPTGWSIPQGAAFLVQGLTSMYGLRAQGGLQPGHTVLVHSAAGGCGQFAMEICHASGAVPVATVGSEGKVAYLLQRFPWLRREQIIVRDSSRFGEQLQAALSAQGAEGFDIVLDAVAGEFFQPGFDALAAGGRYVIYGAANWTPTGDKPGWLRLALQYLRRPRLDPLQMIGQNRSVMGFNLIYLYSRAPLLRRWLQELQELQMPPPNIAKTFKFEEAPAALRFLQSGQATGKVVLSLE